jgi:glutamyl-tRNA reductase
LSPVSVVGVSHLTAPVEIRERFAFAPGEAEVALVGLRGRSDVREAVLLSTCNRTELYVCPAGNTSVQEAAERVLSEKAGQVVGGTQPYLYHHDGEASIRHLYRVAGGLDSLVLGEAEIQGQVRDAYELAGQSTATPPLAGPVLHRLFQSALSVGGRIRSTTPIGEGAASVASVAVGLARKIFGGLQGRQVMILGAGSTAELVVEALGRDGIRGLVVSNRTYERAQELADRLSGKAVRFDEMPFELARTDILIASTAAPHPLVTRDGFRHAREASQRSPLLIIDLAIPRDVEPEVGGEPNVFLYNVDHLHEIMDDNLLKRRSSVPEAEAIVDEYTRDFLHWHGARDVVPVIRSLRGRFDDVRNAELERLLQKLSHLPPDDRESVEAFSKQLVNKLLHDPMKRLKQGAGNGRGVEFVDSVRYLHDLETVEQESAEESDPDGDAEIEGDGERVDVEAEQPTRAADE